MDRNNTLVPNTLILDADDTDITYNNELVGDAMLLMGGMYYVTMHSEASHSTLTPSQRLVLLTVSQVPFPLGGVDGSYPHMKMKSVPCGRLAVCKHWRWLTQCKVCDSTASEHLIFLEFEKKNG